MWNELRGDFATMPSLPIFWRHTSSGNHISGPCSDASYLGQYKNHWTERNWTVTNMLVEALVSAVSGWAQNLRCCGDRRNRSNWSQVVVSRQSGQDLRANSPASTTSLWNRFVTRPSERHRPPTVDCYSADDFDTDNGPSWQRHDLHLISIFRLAACTGCDDELVCLIDEWSGLNSADTGVTSEGSRLCITYQLV